MSFRTIRARRSALSLALVAALSATAAAAAPAARQTDTLSLRLPAAEAERLSAAGIAPQRVRDYGGFLWLNASASERAALRRAGIAFELQPEAGQLNVPGHRFDPLTDGEPRVALKAGEADGRGFRLVQFEGPVRQAWLDQLAAADLKPLQYYPHNAYLVWSEGGAATRLAAMDFVRWSGAFHPDYKLNADVRSRQGRIGNVSIVFHAQGDEAATIDRLRALGAHVLRHHPAQPDRAFFEAIAEVDAASLAALAGEAEVLWIGYSHPTPMLDDEMAAQIVAGNHPGGVPVTGYNTYLTGLGYDGSGVRWAVIDTGVDYDHPDLGPNIVAGANFPGACSVAGEPGSDCPGGGHGTHVAGIIGGTAAGGFTDAGGFLYGLGVAPGYGIVAMNSLMGSAWPPAGGWQENSRVALSLGAVGTNNSWHTGEGTAHGYQASERTHDLMVLDGDFDTPAPEPIIWVFSAGNSGPGASTLTAPKEAKNVITVGSSLNFRAGSIDSMSSFSSRGPAVDGRILPTVAAPGDTIASSRNDDGGSCSTAIAGTSNLYAFCSGTSMAAPQVSGVLAVATEWWRDFNAGANPSPAMAKALLVNSAIDMGTADRPNNSEGWGRVSLERLIVPTQPRVYIDQSELLANTGEAVTLTVAPADPGEPVEISLAWSDAAGAIGANPALVNDLDLVVDDGGTPYFGNVFSAGWSVTGGARDTRANLENVFIQSPSGGAIEINIEATNIAGDGVPNNGDATDQNFALVCTNCVQNPDYTLMLDPTSVAVCAPDDATIDVAVGSLLGYTDAVSLSTSSVPAGLSTAFGSALLTPPNATTLTLGNTVGVAPGSYTLQVDASSTSGSKSRSLGLDLFDASPAAPALTLPAPGAIDVPTSPVLSWSGAAQAASYTVEIATDAGFSNIVYSAVETGTSHAVAATLAPGTEHFWRVRGDNTCGTGSDSTVSNFTTAMVICSSPGVAIPDNNSTGVSSDLVIAAPDAVADLDVAIEATHTWVGDLVFTLTHVETGTVRTLIDRPGRPDGATSGFGCSADNVDAILDDDSPIPVEDACPPVGGAGFSPNQTLAAFNGEALAGTWRLTVSDAAGGDTGSLQSWCLMPVTGPLNTVPVVDDQGFAIDENSANGTAVGTVVASDADPGDVLSYSVTGGSGQAAFALDSNTGEITVTDNAALDFEATPSFTLQVSVSDGQDNDTATITIDLNDVNEAPSVENQSFAIDENSANGTVVGSIAASDPDAGATLGFSVTGGSGQTAFAVDPSSGEITVADAAQLDFEASGNLALQVEVTDGEFSDAATVQIDLNDVDETPVAGTLADQTGVEGETFAFDASGAFVEPDGDALAFSANGLPASLSIDPVTGLISGVPLVGDAGTYAVLVSASDGVFSADAGFELVIAPTTEGIFAHGFED